MALKISIDVIKQIYRNNNLTLLEDKSKGITERYKCCDSDGYLYYYGAKNLKDHGVSDNGVHIFSSKNPYSWDNVIHFMQIKSNNDTILLSDKKEWKNRESVLTFKCGICGQEFKKKWSDFIKLDFKMCTRCYNMKKQQGEVPTKRLNPFTYHDVLKEKGFIPLFGDSITGKDKVLIQDKNGYRGLVNLSSIVHREIGFNKFHPSNPFSIDNLRLYAYLNNWECIVVDQEYPGNKEMLQIRCSCGRLFEVAVTHFLDGKYKCNNCRGAQSVISTKVESWLEENKIVFKKEKTFPDCKNKQVLPFDFYIEDIGCIEVDGIQHFKPINFSKNKDQQELFEQTKINDTIKTEYCKSNNIKLLRIPYWEIEDGKTYKERLEKFLSVGN